MREASKVDFLRYRDLHKLQGQYSMIGDPPSSVYFNERREDGSPIVKARIVHYSLYDKSPDKYYIDA